MCFNAIGVLSLECSYIELYGFFCLCTEATRSNVLEWFGKWCFGMRTSDRMNCQGNE